MSDKIAVVGAGVGGLATAARLAKHGYTVEVYEKLSSSGGRNNILEDKGFRFDMGPSFVLMPDFFEEVFTYCGENIKDYLDLKVLDVNYKIFYPDGDSLTVYSNTEQTKGQLKKFDPDAGKKYDNFIKELKKMYGLVRPLLYKCFSPLDFANPQYWPLIAKIRIFDSYWKLARKFFNNDKLCYALTFEAMFMGVSPFRAPAFYSIITYTDHVQKIWHPMGGMYRIPLALESVSRKFGVKFRYNSPVQKVARSKDKFVLALDRGEVEADKVVINADYSYARTQLLGQRIPDYKYSCSVYLIYLGLKKKIGGLMHHNLFFSGDLIENLKDIFDNRAVPADPSFYVHVPTVTDPSLAPAGKDIVYILIPVPNLKGQQISHKVYEQGLRRLVFDKINKHTGIKLEDLIETEHRFYPQDFIDRYNIKYGATFGLAHNLTQSAFLRPPNFSGKDKNLYFVGASTQPGGGLPVVIAGSRIVADKIIF